MSEDHLNNPGKCLLNYLQANGKTEYGTVILAKEVRDVLGLVYPESASKEVFDKLALAELGAIDYVRNVLLGEGKYFGMHQGNYRILLPSENTRQVEQYMKSADSKLKRALKLSRNTPITDGPPMNDLKSRIFMKRESIRNHRNWKK